MTSRASGTFEVQVKPLPADEKVEGLTVGRMAQLAGLTGTMAIVITDGKHSYEFAYTLPEAP